MPARDEDGGQAVSVRPGQFTRLDCDKDISKEERDVDCEGNGEDPVRTAEAQAIVMEAGKAARDAFPIAGGLIDMTMQKDALSSPSSR